MAQACEVAIEVELLRDHISDAERKAWTIQQVVEFLLESSFKRYGENWIAEDVCEALQTTPHTVRWRSIRLSRYTRHRSRLQ